MRQTSVSHKPRQTSCAKKVEKVSDESLSTRSPVVDTACSAVSRRTGRSEVDALIDNLARILATPYSRRHTLRLIGGALAAGVVGAFSTAAVSARACTRAQSAAGGSTCGRSNDDDRDDDRDDEDRRRGGGDDDRRGEDGGGGHERAICCPRGTCCANGSGGPRCCNKGQCYCHNGSCAASRGGRCPSGCKMCG